MSKLQEPVPSSHSASKAAAADVLETDDPRDFQTDPHDGLTFLLVFTTYEDVLVVRCVVLWGSNPAGATRRRCSIITNSRRTAQHELPGTNSNHISDVTTHHVLSTDYTTSPQTEVSVGAALLFWLDLRPRVAAPLPSPPRAEAALAWPMATKRAKKKNK
ncbi:hypothetical protein O3P69_014710 [Scylla paramamosain]|uniref:Uncharacterized protein n=1 Tax=Scylla paramamosain TaxID=85552 RepID=A0AAW0TXX1_SCYPA